MIQTADIHRISDYECIVTGSFVVNKSHHVIQFRAIPKLGGVHLSHPAINIYGHILSGPRINLNRGLICLGEFLHWTPPSVLPDYQISNYSIYIREANITFHTFDTWMFIPYSDLELHRQYEILISASCCAGQGNETSMSIVTSIAPQIETAVHLFTVINSTTASVSFESKVYDVSCEISFPTSVSINTSCGVHEERNITVNIDGSILIQDVLVPVDQSCNTSLYWNNVLSSTNTVVFNTYQLQSCNISSTNDSITYKCSYANLSVLWGCGVEVINIMNSVTNTSNTTSDNGVINGLCDGTYNVTCYGIPNPTSSDRIIYNDSKYHSMISVNGRDCVVSSSMAEPSFTPTIGPVLTKGTNGWMIAAIVFLTLLVFLLITVIICIIILILLKCQLNKHKGRDNHPKLKKYKGSSGSDEEEKIEFLDRSTPNLPHTPPQSPSHNHKEDEVDSQSSTIPSSNTAGNDVQDGSSVDVLANSSKKDTSDDDNTPDVPTDNQDTKAMNKMGESSESSTASDNNLTQEVNEMSKQDFENLSITQDSITIVHSDVREQEHLKEKTNIERPNDTKSDENVKEDSVQSITDDESINQKYSTPSQEHEPDKKSKIAVTSFEPNVVYPEEDGGKLLFKDKMPSDYSRTLSTEVQDQTTEYNTHQTVMEPDFTSENKDSKAELLPRD